MSADSILYVCDFNAHGGTQTHLLHLLRSIDRRRYRPSLATLNLDAGLAGRLRDLDLEVTNLALEGALRSATWRAASMLAARCRRLSVDLLHGYLFQGNLLAAAVSVLGGAPCITSVRNVDGWKRGRHRLASAMAHRRARRVLFNSRAVRDYTARLEHVSLDRTVVIHNGVEDLVPEKGTAGLSAGMEGESAARGDRAAVSDPDHPTVVCVASLREKKGHVHLLEAFRLVVEKIPGARLVLAGDGPLRGVIESRISAAGLQGAVRLLGHRADIAGVLRGADLFVLSSLEEGMPNALLEAMSAGLPAVVTDVGGNAEVVIEGETGSLVPPAQPGAMAERMIALLSNGALRGSQARAARLRFESGFTLDRMIAAYEDLYSDVLGRGEAA